MNPIAGAPPDAPIPAFPTDSKKEPEKAPEPKIESGITPGQPEVPFVKKAEPVFVPKKQIGDIIVSGKRRTEWFSFNCNSDGSSSIYAYRQFFFLSANDTRDLLRVWRSGFGKFEFVGRYGREVTAVWETRSQLKFRFECILFDDRLLNHDVIPTRTETVAKGEAIWTLFRSRGLFERCRKIEKCPT